jgi:hypothetical protein
MGNTLLDNIKYKKVLSGIVEKDGKRLKKYKRVPRFSPLLRKILFYLFVIVLIAAGIWIHKNS